jgi:hypothetical protein
VSRRPIADASRLELNESPRCMPVAGSWEERALISAPVVRPATENRLAGEQSGQRQQRSRLAQAAINDPAHHRVCVLADVIV